MTSRSGGFATSVAGVLVTRMLSAAASVGVARLLGPSDRGTYALLAFGSAVAAVAATAGIEVWIARAVAGQTVDLAEVRAVARRQLREAAVIVTSIVLAAAALGRGFTPAQFAVGGVMTGITAWSMMRLAVLGGWRHMRRVATAQVSGSATYAVSVAGLLVAGVDSVVAVLAAAALSTATLSTVTGVSLASDASVSRTQIRTARRFGRPIMVGELLSQLTYRADFVLLAAMRGSSAVGLYAVATALSELLWIIPNGVSQLLLPSVAADRDPELTRSVLTVTTALGASGAALLAVVANPIVTFAFGSEFEDATAAVPFLAAAAVAMGAWKLLIADLAARGNSNVHATTAALGLVLMLSLDLPLIDRWGLRGAAISSAVAYTACFAVALAAWRRSTEVRPVTLLYLPSAVRFLRQRSRTAPAPHGA